jgi:hypothetical protein
MLKACKICRSLQSKEQLSINEFRRFLAFKNGKTLLISGKKETVLQ